MEFLTTESSSMPTMPPNLTSIDEVKSTKKTGNRTLSKAVSLHLEGKLESAAKLLNKAIESGENEPPLYSALGHIQYEMRDYDAAARTYAQLVEHDPLHRTAHFNLAVCQGNLKNWKGAAESFRRAAEADGTRSDATLGLGISLIHAGSPAQAMEPLEKYLSLFP